MAILVDDGCCGCVRGFNLVFMIRNLAWKLFGNTRIWRWRWLNKTLHGTRADDRWAQVNRTFEESAKLFKMFPEGETKLRKGNRFLRVFKRTR